MSSLSRRRKEIQNSKLKVQKGQISKRGDESCDLRRIVRKQFRESRELTPPARDAAGAMRDVGWFDVELWSFELGTYFEL
jgi:hypothetical protein